MAKRRGNNEGTIHKLPSGRWHAQITLEGRRLSKVCATQRDCQDWIRKTRGQIDDGMTYASTKLSLGGYLNSWLINTKSAKSQSTWSHYEQLCRNYIVPKIGSIKVRDLRPENIQGFYTSLLIHEVGIYTIRKIHTLLHCALQQAVKTGIIGRNPASFVQPPKVPASEMDILNESQVSQLLVAAMGHRWEALFHLALVTGMRQMELLGLKWADLDWSKQVIKVERQLVRPERQPVRPEGNGVQFSAPKTRYGKRSIALGGKTIEVLRAHYERQQYERLAAGEKWKEYGFIFTNSQGGPIHPRNLLRNFMDLLKTAGLPAIRFHDLRHTAASLMLNNGIPPIVVSRRLGHAKASITLDVYGHLIPSMQAEAAEMIDNLITPIAVQLDQNSEKS